MTRLIVWRHGNTDWNAANRVQGQTDVPLNELGRDQARAAAPLLAALRPDAIVASDLSRAAETAAALAALTGLRYAPTPGCASGTSASGRVCTSPRSPSASPRSTRAGGPATPTRARIWSPCTTSASGSAPRCGRRPTRHRAAPW